MTEDERRVIEARQTLQHLHDLSDMIGKRMRGLPADEAEAVLDRHLAALAMLAKEQAVRSDFPQLVDELGIKMRTVLRERAVRASRIHLVRNGEQSEDGTGQ